MKRHASNDTALSTRAIHLRSRDSRRDGSDEYLAGIMAKIAPTFSAADKRAAVERELVYRRRVFKRLVEAGKMKQSAMDTQIAIFEAIREDYAAAEATERMI